MKRRRTLVAASIVEVVDKWASDAKSLDKLLVGEIVHGTLLHRMASV